VKRLHKNLIATIICQIGYNLIVMIIKGNDSMKKRRVLITVFAVLVGLVISGVVFMNLMISMAEEGLEKMNNMTLSDVNLSLISDGKYEGSYESFPVKVKLRVTVSNHRITLIELLKHDNGQGKDAEKILDRIIENQTIKVDVISGATYSSKVIQKAVEVALLGSSD